MTNPNQLFIGILGVDGVGKTTHVQKLISTFRDEGIELKYVWFRFFHLTTLFLLLYGRIFGYTKYETKNNILTGRHDFSKSRLLKKNYPKMLFFDMHIYYVFKIFIPYARGNSIICDRFVYDTIVDLMVDLEDYELYKKPIAHKFLTLIPKDAMFFLIDLDVKTIVERRQNLCTDDTLIIRRNLYKNVAEFYNIKIISNENSIENVQRILLDSCKKNIEQNKVDV